MNLIGVLGLQSTITLHLPHLVVGLASLMSSQQKLQAVMVEKPRSLLHKRGESFSGAQQRTRNATSCLLGEGLGLLAPFVAKFSYTVILYPENVW